MIPRLTVLFSSGCSDVILPYAVKISFAAITVLQ